MTTHTWKLKEHHVYPSKDFKVKEIEIDFEMTGVKCYLFTHQRKFDAEMKKNARLITLAPIMKQLIAEFNAYYLDTRNQQLDWSVLDGFSRQFASILKEVDG